MTSKVTARHLCRKAMVYVRQSSSHQVLHNTESRRLQYEMKQRLQSLGWSDVDIIDEDLGRSAASTAGRSGFQRMVAEVCLGRVGAVAAREVSRFARNNHDWHQLIEVCSLVDTLLVDHDTVYDPRHANDRLVLGLKGSMSEYELDLLRQRSLEARWAKARRGELVIAACIGYVKTPDQRLELDPDARIRDAILLVFDKFFELGSARQTHLWFLDAEINLPAWKRAAGHIEICWRRPLPGTIRSILTDPTYAGAYAYGKTETVIRVQDGVAKKTQQAKPLKDWGVLIRDHHEGYISWDQFKKIQNMLTNNGAGFESARHGAAKTGSALLAGLLRCRRCGRKLLVNYTGTNHAVPRYCCRRGHRDQGVPSCISFGGAMVDLAVAQELLRVVQPCAIEAAAMAVADDNHRRSTIADALLQELKAARYNAERARKQFDAVDPENRLVADELERRWNAALKTTCEVEARLQQEQQRTQQNAPAHPENLGNLAGELERAWCDPQTDIRLKKRIARALLFEIMVDLDQETGEVELLLHWQGGIHTTLRVQRRRLGDNSIHTSSDTADAIRVLARVCNDAGIASFLNRNGLRTGRGNRWTQQRVASARSKRGILPHDCDRQNAEGWMTLTQAAHYLGTTLDALRKAVEANLIAALHPLPYGPWLLRRDDLDAAKAQDTIPGTQGRPETVHSTQLTLEIPNT